MFCTNCGKQLAEGARFCSFCGAQVQLAERNEPNPGQGARPAAPVETGFQPGANAGQPNPYAGPAVGAPGTGVASGQILLELNLYWELHKYVNGTSYGASMAEGKKITICDDKIVLHASNSGSLYYDYLGLVGLGIRKAMAKKNPYIIYPFNQIKHIFPWEIKPSLTNRVMTWLVIELWSGEGFTIATGNLEKGIFFGNAAVEVQRILNTISPYLNR